MYRGKAISNPCDGVGLAGACGVLNQIVLSHTVALHITHDFSNNIILMVAWENHLFLGDCLANTVLDHLFLFLYEGNEAVNEVKQAVSLENFFPQIACGISIRILWITCAASYASTIGTLVEGEKTGIVVCKLCGHPRFVKINGEVNQEAMVQTECKFFGTSVILILIDSAYIVLPGQLVF